MSAKNSYTTADYIEWNTAVNLVHCLFKDKDYKMSLLIGCVLFLVCVFLTYYNLVRIWYDMLLNESSFEIIEKKTQKRREVRINNGFQKHIIDCYNALFITDKSEKYLKSSERRVYSIQRINMLLKDIKKKYGIKSVKSFSTHSLR